MYTTLLDAAINDLPSPDDEAPATAALAKVLLCRSRLGADALLGRHRDGDLTAVADELAYDVALIDLARQLGIPCDASAFDPPQGERRRVEKVLATRGIHLDEFDDHRGPTEDR
ncbi:MAG TPA: hypothetical protein VN796_05055 [Acidimicrobiales bacterium]|nr:hypothetical protein [Acidimicrobiales bacterium]